MKGAETLGRSPEARLCREALTGRIEQEYFERSWAAELLRRARQ